MTQNMLAIAQILEALSSRLNEQQRHILKLHPDNTLPSTISTIRCTIADLKQVLLQVLELRQHERLINTTPASVDEIAALRKRLITEELNRYRNLARERERHEKHPDHTTIAKCKICDKSYSTHAEETHSFLHPNGQIIR